MNTLLLEPGELDSAHGAVRIEGRRCQHLHTVLKVAVGDTVRVGVLAGRMGTATVARLASDRIELDVVLDRDPPPPVPITLVLALPRPKVVRRVLQAVAALGVKRLQLVGGWRVEKSYWESPFLGTEAIREQLVLGLEQSGDTIVPVVELRRLFKPFVEDELRELAADTRRLVAHPPAAVECPRALATPVTLVVGPEGGFTPYEVDLLAAQGFEAVSLGARVLRVEQVVPYLIGRMC